MRKILFTVLLLSVLPVLWSFDYYKSNILGMKLGAEQDSPPEDAEFILRIEKDSEKEKHSLFRGAEIYFIRTFEKTDGGEVEITRKDNLTETVIRRRGLIISEKKEEEGKPAELVEYSYKQGRLTSSEYSMGGELVYTEIYTYAAGSRLLDVKRMYTGVTEGSLSSFMFDNGRLRTYWFENGSGHSLMKFDREGIFFSEILSDGGWSETREYGRDEQGRRFELVRNDKGEKIYLLYNKSGSLQSSSSFDAAGGRTEQLLYHWEKEQLIYLTIKRDLSTEKFSFEYDSEGMMLNETYSKNGIIIQETTYNSGDDRVEKLYRYGKPILRITYRGGERVETEQLQER
ncbi:MAG: hypothetical protein JEZ04_04835 [Spirochaetales bacterium]|nr:hypothetical protein [Spirochaetales bacterium]